MPEVERCTQGVNAREPRVADDFTWIDVHGVRHELKPGRQANSIRILYEAWVKGGKRDGSGIAEKEIGERIESSAERFRIDRVFEGHPILRSILRSPGKGQWALYFESPTETDSSQDVDAASWPSGCVMRSPG